VTLVTGLIFIACVLAFRRGVVGELSHRWRRRGERRTPGR
jgi:branched-chain amino acid transport system permease protein